MFTEQQLKEAHGKVKTGADFPKYVNEIKQLGLLRYEFWVDNGRVIYYGDNGHKVKSDPKYPQIQIAENASPAQLQHTITIHQQGLTDFFTFCKEAAAAGVEKWVIDTQKMLCIYYDSAGNEMIAEPIPQII
ncbi:Uncharacterized conserved protein YbcV, DUF1398 family [Mucilaginibacter gossypiicola]|uniref:Uncharacterized conserved protein YbcV, DUF1398 family n=1 Tax=Mucilaginibacter gossypiicola TaxID=551995 RepID=A0A1H8E087_9SPHI|nr:DUF1398 family protein [Mucilaginibacter gossypiicola]SEN12882.1 Uncharacterized conserved protein YbcV, DUF1398 family [Mucilaginibacter gossypiicola]